MSHDIGGLGPRDGVPIGFHWHLAWTLIRFLPWCILLPLLLLRTNRDPRAWWILAPVLLVHVMLSWLDAALGQMAGAWLSALGLAGTALGAVCLTGERFAAWRAGPRICAALAVVAGVGISGIVAYTGFGEGYATAELGIVYGAVSLCLLIALAGAGRAWRRRRSVVRMGLALACWMFGAIAAVLLVVYVVMAAQSAPAAFLNSEAIIGLLIGAATASVVLLILLAPFLVLIRLNSLYRRRFTTMFAPPGPAPPESVLAA